MEVLSPYRTRNQFYSNREQRALNFFNQSHNINTEQETTLFARERPKEYKQPYRTEDDIKNHARQFGIPTAASFTSPKKNPYYSGHNEILLEKVHYTHQKETRKLGN